MAAIVFIAPTLAAACPGPALAESEGRATRVLPVVVNARVLATGEGGVRRVAAELLRALDALLPARGYAELARLAQPRDAAHFTPPRDAARFMPPWDMTPLIPPPARPRPAPPRGAAQLWEQAGLPLAARGRLVLGFGNQGPVVLRNAITMIHDAQVFASPASYSPGFRLWYRASLPLIGRRHRRILTVSRFAAGELARFGIARPERITVVPNGVDHILRPAPDHGILARLGLVPGGYACAVASTRAHKNVPLLLAAFARPELAQATLVLTGPARRADFAAPVPGNVVFAGEVSDAELRALLEAALCQLCPSTTEGFGLPPLEAMRLGTPAVIAPTGALPETCGAAALRAPPDDPAAWAAAVARLAADSGEARARGAAGRDHARHFTWARAAEAVLAVLEAECPEPAP
jgi:glycosyltransferase involved in cell wall biosynthesis